MGRNLEHQRAALRKVSPDALVQKHREAEAGFHTHSMKVHRNLVKAVMRERGEGDHVMTPAQRTAERRQREHAEAAKTLEKMISEAVEIITLREDEQMPEHQQTLSILRHKLQHQAGAWEEVDRRVRAMEEERELVKTERLIAEAVGLKTQDVGTKGLSARDVSRLTELQTELLKPEAWGEVQRLVEQKRDERRMEAQRLTSRPKVECPDAASMTMYVLQEAIGGYGRACQMVSALQAMGGVYRDLAQALKQNVDNWRQGPTLRSLCSGRGTTVEQLIIGLNTPQSPFTITIVQPSGGRSGEGRQAESQDSKKVIRLGDPDSATIGDLRRVAAEQGRDFETFIYYARKGLRSNSFAYLFFYYLSHALRDGTTLSQHCANYQLPPFSEIVTEVNSNPEASIRIEFGVVGGSAEAAKQKPRILLSSKLMGGREICEAVEAAGVSIADFCNRLVDADDDVEGAWELQEILMRRIGEGRPDPETQEPILLEFAHTLKELAKCDSFPYSIEFVLHDDDELAKMRLKPAQLWFQCGQKDRAAKKPGNADPVPPPCPSTALQQAYYDGYDGGPQLRTQYFPEEAGRRSVPDNRPAPFTLQHGATLAALIGNFPGGADALRATLVRAKVPFSLTQGLFDPAFKTARATDFFPSHQYSAQWFRDILGLTFAENEE